MKTVPQMHDWRPEPPPLSSPAPRRLCRNIRNLIIVMLSKAKHLAFSGRYKVEILRLRLRMTLRHSLARGRMKEGELQTLEAVCGEKVFRRMAYP